MNVKYITESEIIIDGKNRYEIANSQNYTLDFDRKHWMPITAESLTEKFNLKIKQFELLQKELLNLQMLIEETSHDGIFKFIGNCNDSFHEDTGNCIRPQLPFNHVSDLEKFNNGSSEIPTNELPEEIRKCLQDMNIMNSYGMKHQEYPDVVIIFDTDKEEHNFFIR